MDSGTRLGHYEILELLGAGGMGEVYRAHDPELGRDVAIKVLPEYLSHDAERLARLRREARSLASLNHSGIATIHGFEAHEGTRFIVMELLEGPTLAESIWAFGCLLYEMLVGKGPFAAETPSDTLAAVLTREPDWSDLPDATPSQVRDLLRRCLQKDPENSACMTSRRRASSLTRVSRTPWHAGKSDRLELVK